MFLNHEGVKGRNLERLRELGFPIPAFVILSPDEATLVLDCAPHPESPPIKRLVDRIQHEVPAARYAVRSNSASEDGATGAMAGQFHTELDVDPGRLVEAIAKVVRQSLSVGVHHSKFFSVIVQEYIRADFSGITFTRAPTGGREMVIEYAKVRYGEVVGGTVTPVRIRAFHGSNQTAPTSQHIPPLEVFSEVEHAFDSPCDIEWCVKTDQGVRSWYLLQARPITTVTATQFAQARYLDSILPRSGPFHFQKTPICEIAPRPDFLTLDLLERIYASDGPVALAYRDNGISYRAQFFLSVLGNELFVDRERELKSLMPSLTYRDRSKPQLQLTTFVDLLVTFRNSRRLRKMSPPQPESVRMQLADFLRADCDGMTLSSALSHFLHSYKTVFLVNLYTARTLRDLEHILGREKVYLSSLLGCRESTFSSNHVCEPPTSPLVGNTLDLGSNEPFVPSANTDNRELDLHPWFSSLSKWRQIVVRRYFDRAAEWMRLRENGRWVTVLFANAIRRALVHEASRHGVPVKNLHLCTFDEILADSLPDRATLTDRQEKYDRYASFRLPALITDRPTESFESNRIGVSPGRASGVLATSTDLPVAGGNVILYTTDLTPDLVAHFKDVKGIISKRGGILSHLAIMAREAKIPVVIDPQFEPNQVDPGRSIEIDGESGVIVCDTYADCPGN